MQCGILAALLLLYAAGAHAGNAANSGKQADTADSAAGQPAPDLRIVTLAPHLAELLFAVGAGERLVGVSAYTDYPPAAASLPVVGDAFAVDQERLAMLAPDLLLTWKSGTPAMVVDRLTAQGYRVETVETRGLDDVALALQQIGQLTGHQSQAAAAAADYRAGLQRIANQYRDALPIRVFYQVSHRPLFTINGQHYVSELIALCGGHNIFADLGDLAPLVDVEAVLARDPEAVLASSDSLPDAFDGWRRWPTLAANRHGNYFLLPADDIVRATPRLLKAGAAMCRTLDRARANRGNADD